MAVLRFLPFGLGDRWPPFFDRVRQKRKNAENWVKLNQTCAHRGEHPAIFDICAFFDIYVSLYISKT